MNIEKVFPYTDLKDSDMTCEISNIEENNIELAWLNPNADFPPNAGRILIRYEPETKTLHFDEFALNTQYQKLGVMSRFIKWVNKNLFSNEVTKLSVYTHLEVISKALKSAGWVEDSERANTFIIEKNN